MDKSKLPKQSPKSSETPWEPTDPSRSHERTRLSDRAGSTAKSRGTSIIPPIGVGLMLQEHGRVGKKKKKSWAGDDITEANVKEGKVPGTNKPKSKRRIVWRWETGAKKKGEESEY